MERGNAPTDEAFMGDADILYVVNWCTVGEELSSNVAPIESLSGVIDAENIEKDSVYVRVINTNPSRPMMSIGDFINAIFYRSCITYRFPFCSSQFRFSCLNIVTTHVLLWGDCSKGITENNNLFSLVNIYVKSCKRLFHWLIILLCTHVYNLLYYITLITFLVIFHSNSIYFTHDLFIFIFIFFVYFLYFYV